MNLQEDLWKVEDIRWSSPSNEAKEGVKIQRESKTLATITFQNYFRMYAKLSGMTGTALTEEKNLEKFIT